MDAKRAAVTARGKVKYKFFYIPAQFPEHAAQELNAFLASNAVLNVDKQFCSHIDNPGWSVCVSLSDGTPVFQNKRNDQKVDRERVDYREVLNEEDFAVYAQLRELRKTLSQESGQPVYQIFSNKQLAELVTRRVRSKKDMSDIEGIGASRLEQYASAFIELLVQLQVDENR